MFSGKSFWSVASTTARVGSVLVYLPAILTVFTTSELGVYYVFASISGMVLLLESGVAQSIIRAISYTRAGAQSYSKVGLPRIEINEIDVDHTQTLFKNFGLTNVSYALLFLLSFAVSTILCLLTLSSENLQAANISFQLVFIFIISISISMFLESGRTFIFANDQAVAAQKITIISHALASVVILIGIYSGLGLWVVVLHRLTLGISSFTLSRVFRPNLFPRSLFKSPMYTKLFLTIWPMTWKQWVVSLGDFAFLRSIVLLSSIVFGLEVTAELGLTMQMLGIIAAVCIAPLNVRLPELSFLRVSGDMKSLNRVFHQILYLGLLLLLAIGTITILVIPHVLDYFGIEARILPLTSAGILLIGFVIHQHKIAAIAYVTINNVNPFVKPILLSIAIVIPLTYMVGSITDLNAMLITLIVTSIATLHWVVLREKARYEKNN